MKALLIILIVLTVIALFPVGVDGGYRQKTVYLNVKAGFILLRILPKKPKPPKVKKPKKPKKITETPETEEKKPKKSFDIKEFLPLIKPALKAMSRFRKKLTIEYLRVHYTVATGDPADTAINYGRANAVLGAVYPLLDSAFDIRRPDVGIDFDFMSDEPVIDLWLTATYQLWELFYIAGAFAIDFLKIKIKQKKASKNERNEENGQTSHR